MLIAPGYNPPMPLDRKARQYADTLFTDRSDENSRAYQRSIIATTNQMAARGQLMSGAYYSELVRMGVDNIRALAHAKADSLVTAHEISKTPFDTEAAENIFREAEGYCQIQAQHLAKDIKERAGRAGMETIAEPFVATIVAEASSVADEISRKLLRKVYEASATGAQASEPTPEELDDLLPIFPKRRFNPDLVSLAAEADASKPLGLLVIDFDHFKSVNDEFGHSVGDEVLVATSSTVRSVCEGKGNCYRWGGDELAVLLPNHTVHESKAIAHRIGETVAELKSPNYPNKVTLSIGVASYPGCCASARELFDAADAAAKEAKKAGRNRVSIAKGAAGAKRTDGGDRKLTELREKVRQLGRDLFGFLRDSAVRENRAAYVEAIHHGYLHRFRMRTADLFNELSEAGIPFDLEPWEIDPPEIAREKSVRHIAEECFLIAARMEIQELAEGISASSISDDGAA